jgi:hypothetical protein
MSLVVHWNRRSDQGMTTVSDSRSGGRSTRMSAVRRLDRTVRVSPSMRNSFRPNGTVAVTSSPVARSRNQTSASRR